MIKTLRLIPFLLLLSQITLAADSSVDSSVNLSGKWVISSSVGGETPVTVFCTLIQQRNGLSGACTPEMESAQPSDLSGSVDGNSAFWGYDVVFNGNPGTVTFTADSISNTEISGTLSLSGIEAPFAAVRE